MTAGMHQILADGGDQVVTYTPAERVDATPAPSWSLEDLFENVDSPDRVLASGTATVDPANAPILADAGPTLSSPRVLQIPGAAYEAGQAYSLEAIDGTSELVFVADSRITEVELVSPVRGSFPAGSSILHGLQISATVPAAVAGDEDFEEDEHPLEITWSFHVRGRLRRVTELARVVRGTGDARYSVPLQESIEGAWPELAQELERDPHRFARMIRYCERKVQTRLRASRIDPERFLAGPQGFDLLLARVLLHMADQGLYPRSRDPEVFRTERRDEYVAAWNDLTTGTPGRDVVEKDVEQHTTAAHSKRRRFTIDIA